MTMPYKLYVAPGSGFDGNEILIADESDWSEDGVKFVRADIAEELARALEEIAGMDLMSASAVAYNALSRFRAITP